MAELSPMLKAARTLFKGIGTSMRTMGRSIDSFGVRLQEPFAAVETVSRHQQFMRVKGKTPEIGDSVFVAPNASLIGDVKLGDLSSVWYGAIIRGDVNKVKIGSKTNIQDRAIVHVAKDPKPMGTEIGDMVSIGHRATIHAAIIEDKAIIGMGATVLDGCVVQTNSYVAPGAMLLPNTIVKSGELWAGSPAKLVRKLNEEEKEKIVSSAEDYLLIAEAHLFETTKNYERQEFDKIKRKLLEARTVWFQEWTKTVGLAEEQSELQARMDMEQRRRHWGG
uniref:Uncharacterized protein n=3 Tax=Rhodosorus marinus TaxID=101924 RepID=A0A7S2ZTJ0_9RHOD|mmetsp:Transcript_30215/g.115879  ORF Transcript_30215/g.115879 Transcript_30215/m.115879 type:complete len:278 (+) Transcript_30215:159-992(+)